MNIVVIDYGLGNLASVYNALRFLGADGKVGASAREVEKADKLVLPGVGSFGGAIRGLGERGLMAPLKKALASGKPYLGICLGLQILFEKSEEGGAEGLGIFKGQVKRFREKDGVKVPHIGWNNVKLQITNCKLQISKGIEDASYFYFDHSYYAEPGDERIVSGRTDYGVNFASMICKDNICAVQFHPERSQELGLKLLKNFLAL